MQHDIVFQMSILVLGRLNPREDSTQQKTQPKGILNPGKSNPGKTQPNEYSTQGNTQPNGKLNPREDSTQGKTQPKGRPNPRGRPNPEEDSTQGKTQPRGNSTQGKTQPRGRLNPGEDSTQGKIQPRGLSRVLGLIIVVSKVWTIGVLRQESKLQGPPFNWLSLDGNFL